jgi:hypothetical protein
VGIARRWAYLGPLCTATGSVWLVLAPAAASGGAAPIGLLLIAAGSAVMLAIFGVVLWREPSLFSLTMTLGTLAWIGGNIRLPGAPVADVVLWWLAFPVLTIAGERLELTRMLRPSRLVQSAFVAAVAAVLAGVVTSAWRPEGGAGVRLMGAGLVALSLWLARFDIARRTIRQTGVTRFIAACLLSGYVWLGVGGLLAVAVGPVRQGADYDAVLHAIFIGFVVSMIFGHAPIVFPAVLGKALPYHPAFYAHLALLHVSVAARLAGDLVEPLARWRAWGGLLNALALALFLVNSIRAAALARVPTAGAGSGRPS